MGKVVYFEKPISKHYTELVPGDVFKTEYADYGNWIEVVFHHYEVEEGGWIKTVGRYANSEREFSGYSSNYKDGLSYEVVGREEEA